MYAVIKTGGKQYRVETDSVFPIEKLEAEVGDKITFDQVLMVGEGDKVTLGTPTVAGATVTAEVMEQKRTRKILVFRRRRRKNFRRTNGHRQHQTVVKITGIKGAK
ncbi:MAG: 50S ribosomal protein L21 [Alphaproteobacteria bacterium]